MAEVTVVIPTHNRSDMVGHTIQCALRQNDVDLEVVVVDDGSTDQTADVITHLGDARIVLVRQDRAEGVSAARNRGIARATGEWIAFLDDDDLWSPDKLAAQLHAATSLSRCWACTGSVAVNTALDIVAGGPPLSADAMVRQLPLRNVVPAGASNVIARRSALVAIGGFDVRLRHLADWDVWIRLAELGPPAVVGEPLVAYVLHPTNASGDAGTIAAELARIEQRYREHRRGVPIDRAFAYRWAAWHFLRVGRRDRAVRAYLRAIMAGDLASVARGVVALVDPGIAQRPLKRHRPDPAWEARAQTWLLDLTPA